VGLEDARGFSRVWNYNGITIIFDDVHLTFARDFANVTLNSLVNRIKASQAQPKILTEGINEHTNVTKEEKH
jgi:hypothetical protein